MADIIDVLHRITQMAGMSADTLRAAIAEAQAVLDKLDSFTNDAEDGYCLIAASDIMPGQNASIPKRAGLVKAEPIDPLPPKDHTCPPYSAQRVAFIGNELERMEFLRTYDCGGVAIIGVPNRAAAMAGRYEGWWYAEPDAVIGTVGRAEIKAALVERGLNPSARYRPLAN